MQFLGADTIGPSSGVFIPAPDQPSLTLSHGPSPVPLSHPGIFRFQLLSEHHVGPKMTIDCGAAAFVIRLAWI